MTNRVLSEERIREVESAYDRAWAAADVAAMVACFTKEAVVVNPRGEIACGAAEISEALGSFLSGPAQGSIHESRIIHSAFVTDDVAVVDGEATIRNAKKLNVLFKHRFTDILLREQDAWRIAHVRAYALSDAFSIDEKPAQQIAPPDAASRRG
jgi:uncharacterized protein (TIGR02246 family)